MQAPPPNNPQSNPSDRIIERMLSRWERDYENTIASQRRNDEYLIRAVGLERVCDHLESRIERLERACGLSEDDDEEDTNDEAKSKTQVSLPPPSRLSTVAIDVEAVRRQTAAMPMLKGFETYAEASSGSSSSSSLDFERVDEMVKRVLERHRIVGKRA